MSPSPHMDTRPYTEFINVGDGNDWVGFHKTFWGQESAITKVHETAFLDVSDERLKDASGLFFHFTDKIYVRKDYQELYTYLCDEFDKGSLGVIVSGSPGTGKSFFNLYALARRLAQKKTTILRTGPGFCFIFDEQGPSGIPDPSKLGHDKLRLPVSRRQDFIWVLYDSHQKSAEPLSAFTTRSSFLVQTTSPDADNFFHWYKQGSPFVGIWYMNVWGFEELRAGLELHNRHLKEEDYYCFYGPCIRDHLIGRKHFITACKQAVTSINNVQKFAHAFEAVTSLEPALNSRVPHRIFILRVLEDGEERREKPALDFKSAYTLEQIREKFAQVKSFEPEILFNACQGVSQTGILRDWVFENLAIEYTSGNMKSFRKKVGPLYDMIQVPMVLKTEKLGNSDEAERGNKGREQGQQGEKQHRKQKEKDWRQDVGTVHGTGSLGAQIPMEVNEGEKERKRKGEEELGEEEARRQKAETEAEGSRKFVLISASDDKYPFRKMTICRYDEFKDITISNKYYVPRNKSNAFFDSFFLDIIRDDLAIVWILWMTTNIVSHKSSSQVYKVLEQLRDQVQTTVGNGSNVEFRYLWVVPKDEEGPVATCFFPPDGSDGKWIAGKVYVQYVDVSSHFQVVSQRR